MRKKCNAIGHERIAIRATAATWRKGAVTLTQKEEENVRDSEREKDKRQA